VRRLARQVKGVVVPEVNFGQLVYEVDRSVRDEAKTILMPLLGGTIHKPEDILAKLKEVAE
jgi:2-oxoglutarate ferredoxin oxidoreductase subunit alpha